MLLNIGDLMSWMPEPLNLICIGVVSIVMFVVLARIIMSIIDVISSVVMGIKGLLIGIFGGF